MASRYLHGEGIEIGALHRPLELPRDASVRYVDRLTVEELRAQYPELSSENLVPVDIVDDGETLASVPEQLLDFVIANHMIEHCQNPILALTNWLRVLRPKGVVYMAAPDKRFTFDHRRPITSLEHVLRDWQEGPEWSRKDHYAEWTRLVQCVSPAEAEQQACDLDRSRYSIHFHVWDAKAFREFLDLCRGEIAQPFEVRTFVRNGSESIVILIKND